MKPRNEKMLKPDLRLFVKTNQANQAKARELANLPQQRRRIQSRKLSQNKKPKQRLARRKSPRKRNQKKTGDSAKTAEAGICCR